MCQGLLDHAIDELEPYLNLDYRFRPGTGTGSLDAPKRRCPALWRGVPLYDATLAWIMNGWGGYGGMPPVGYKRWAHLLKASRGQSRNLNGRLEEWADWLASEGYVASSEFAAPIPQANKGKAGRRGYPLEALAYARQLRTENPTMKAAAIRGKCLERFSEDDIPPDPESFRRWLNRKRANRAN